VIPPATVGLKKYAQPVINVAPTIPSILPIVALKLVLLIIPDVATVSVDASELITTPKTSALSTVSALANVKPVVVTLTTLPAVIPEVLGDIVVTMVFTKGALLKDTVLVKLIGPVKVTGVATEVPCLIV
jgi:hypothetical protein